MCVGGVWVGVGLYRGIIGGGGGGGWGGEVIWVLNRLGIKSAEGCKHFILMVMVR